MHGTITPRRAAAAAAASRAAAARRPQLAPFVAAVVDNFGVSTRGAHELLGVVPRRRALVLVAQDGVGFRNRWKACVALGSWLRSGWTAGLLVRCRVVWAEPIRSEVVPADLVGLGAARNL